MTRDWCCPNLTHYILSVNVISHFSVHSIWHMLKRSTRCIPYAHRPAGPTVILGPEPEPVMCVSFQSCYSSKLQLIKPASSGGNLEVDKKQPRTWPPTHPTEFHSPFGTSKGDHSISNTSTLNGDDRSDLMSKRICAWRSIQARTINTHACMHGWTHRYVWSPWFGPGPVIPPGSLWCLGL